MKKLLSLLITLTVILSCVTVAGAEESDDLTVVLKENIRSAWQSEFGLEFDSADSFDNLKLNVLLKTDTMTFFKFSCKEMEKYKDGYPYSDYLGDYIYLYYPQSKIFVYAPSTFDKLLDLTTAYEYGAVNDSQVQYLCENCSYKEEDKLPRPDYVRTKVSDNPPTKSPGGYLAEHYFYEDEGEDNYWYIETSTYYSDDNVALFMTTVRPEYAIDGMFSFTLGNYYFDDIIDNMIYVYDKKTKNVTTIRMAYDKNIVGDDILEYLSIHYFQNNIYTPNIRLGEKTEPDTNTDGYTYTVRSNNEQCGTTTPSGKQTCPLSEANTSKNISASPKKGCRFLRWLKNGELYSTEPEASILLREADGAVLTAVFRPVIEVAGDVNVDESLDIVDIAMTRSYIVGQSHFKFAQRIAADVSKDSKVDIVDVAMIRDAVINGKVLPLTESDEKIINVAKMTASDRIGDTVNYEFEIWDADRQYTVVQGTRVISGILKSDECIRVTISNDDFIPAGTPVMMNIGAYKGITLNPDFDVKKAEERAIEIANETYNGGQGDFYCYDVALYVSTDEEKKPTIKARVYIHIDAMHDSVTVDLGSEYLTSDLLF